MPTAARMAPAGRWLARPIAAIAALALVVAVGSPIQAVRAQAPLRPKGPPTGPITQITFEGLETVKEEAVLALLKSKVGRDFDPLVVEDDLQALTKKGWFSDIRPFTKPDPDHSGVKLIFTVQEAPILREVEFRGMTKLKVKDVEQNTGIKKGARADHVKSLLAAQSIQRMYEEKGYDLAQVRLIEGSKPNSRKAIYEIFEGPKCRVTAVTFEGNDFISDGVLETKVQSGPRLMGLVPKKFSPEELADDRKKLLEYYEGQGFLEAKVTPVVRPGADVGSRTVTFVIWEGVQYKVRSIRFSGNEQLKTEKLMEGMKLQKDAPFSESLREVDEKLVKSKYGAIGCIAANVVVQHEYLDQTEFPGKIDLVYTIEEGAPYTLGRIIIKGNGRTQDRVIRREAVMAGLIPGQPLDSNRIDIFKKRLGNLRYFAMDPQMGKPLTIDIINQRSGAEPYGGGVQAQFADNDVLRTRLQNPSGDDRPAARVARQAPEGPALGDGPASLAPIAEPPPDFQIPAIDAPGPPPLGAAPGAAPAAPPAGVGPFNPNAPADRTPPLGNREPPGTFPSIPGMNATDVGPDRQEPFANRSFADIVTSVDETATGQFMFGVGASSYGGLFANFILHEGNFDYKAVPKSFRDLFSGGAFRGAGQDLRIELSPGTQINRAQITFRNPYLFNLPIGLGMSAYTFRRFYTDWTEDRAGGRFSLGRQFGTRTYADVAFRIEDVNVHGFNYPAPADLLAVNGHTTLATIRPTLRFDNRNDPFASTAGQYLEFAFEQGWGNFTFPKITVEGRQYITLGSRPDGSGKRFVTLRGFYGVTGRDTPIYERFYAGDFRSMRGFSYRGVGPHELGVNVGGLMTAIGSVEYQFPWIASDKLQQVVFCDFGTVEPGYSFTTFRAAVGTGLRIYLPQQMFGPLPLAFDLAFPVAKGPDDHTKVFTFFIGAFW